MWEPEEIPDAARVFMRAQKSFFRNGQLQPGVFRDHGAGMSVDWDRYSTALEAHGRCKVPADNAIISMEVGGIRAIQQLSVNHTPLEDNRAHSHVIGEKSPEARVLLGRLVRFEIQLQT